MFTVGGVFGVRTLDHPAIGSEQQSTRNFGTESMKAPLLGPCLVSAHTEDNAVYGLPPKQDFMRSSRCSADNAQVLVVLSGDRQPADVLFTWHLSRSAVLGLNFSRHAEADRVCITV